MQQEGYVYISESLQVDWKKELGKGSIGEVYPGKIRRGGIVIECAAKIIGLKSRKMQDITYFKKEAEFS